MSDHELLFVGFTVAFPLLALLARYVAMDLDRQGVAGWIVGLAVMVTPPVGLPLWVIARWRRARKLEAQS